MRNIRFFLTLFVSFSFAFTCAIAAHPVKLPFPISSSIIQSENAESLFQLAMSLYRQQKYAETLEKCQQAIALNPKDHRPHALTGFVFMAQQKMKSASEAFAKAIQLQPQNKFLYLSKASADLQRNVKEEAIVACQKAIQIDPNYTEAYALLGDAWRWDDAHRQDAIAAYRKASSLNPKLLVVYEPLGELLFEINDVKGAEEIFQQAMSIDPQKMAGRFAFGRKLVKLGRLADARELWNGRTSDKDNTIPNFITVLERAENLQQAQDAVAKNPKDPELLVNLGMAVMEGDPWIMDQRQVRAIEYFKQALALNPRFARAQYGICKAYIQMHKPYDDNSKNIAREMTKLRKLSPALAKELDEYRKNGGEGVPGGIPVNLNQ